ncbi:3-hydroxyisobutyrate dehydrogenase [Microbacterium sp. RURRCA19A]|nr:3-hydroxyisobutyrate dehydrogenase [Microbacterium sp. RURRCA19A]
MKTAIIGTGLMGSAFAEALLRAGHDVTVYNRSAEKTVPLAALGATPVATAAAAIHAADAVIFVLADGASLETMLASDDARAALAGKRLLNASTTSADEIEKLAAIVTAHRGALAEASIMVGPDQLRDGSSFFILGARDEDQAFWTDLLGNIGGQVQVAGGVGDASRAEIPILIASVFGNVAASYAAAMTMRMGLPQDMSRQLIEAALPASAHMLDNLFARDYDTVMASVDSFTTVARTAADAARTLDMDASVFDAMGDLYTRAAANGYAQKDGTAIAEILSEPIQGAR